MLRPPLSWLVRLLKGCFAREMAPIVVLLVMAALIRLPLMIFQGYWHDLASYVNWGNELVRHGFGNLYAVRANNMALPGANIRGGIVFTSINYPPGTPYMFSGLVLLYNHTLAPVIHVPLTDLVNYNGLGPFVAKMLVLVADLATTTLLYREARKRHSQRFAWFAAASFAFSPAVLYDGVIWGQTDTLVALPVLIGLFAILSGRYSVGGISFALAVLIKAQSVIFIPLLLLYLWRWTRHQDFRRFMVSLLGTVLLALLPVMIPRFQLFDMLYNMRAMSYNGNVVISRDAFNFWWFIGLHARSMNSLLLGVQIGLMGDLLFGAVTLLNGVHIWRRQHPAYLCFGLALEVFGFFMFMGGQLERYLFLFIPLMLATLIVSEWKSSDRLLILYLAGTLLCFLNMVTCIGDFLTGISPMIPYVTFQPLTGFIVSYFADIAFAISAYLVATYAYAMYVYLTGRFVPLVEVTAQGQHMARDGVPTSVSSSQL